MLPNQVVMVYMLYIFKKKCYFCRLRINQILTVNMSVCLLLEFLAWVQTFGATSFRNVT
jgi:hypothetical protein